MTMAKRITVAVVTLAIAAGAGLGGYKLLKDKDSSSASGEVYVTDVSELNTAAGLSLSGSRFSGVIEAQKTEDYKYDTSKTVASIKVKAGDKVSVGDVLFSYDVESMELTLEEGKLEVERMENELQTSNDELASLEKEKASADQDGQASLNTQILSLKSDITKAEYDIKAKKAENKKTENSIKNADVLSETEGTVKTVVDITEIANAENSVIVSISKGDDYRVKGTVNEQMINNIYVDMPVIIRSRVDDSVTWSGVISEIETTPQTSTTEYYDDTTDQSNTSSKYSFYVSPDSLDGLMLGQHILIEPDTGDNSIDKKGIWLYSDYVFEEDGKSYVWAKDKKDKIEKREVVIGQTDEANGDCEIKSGLKKSDQIAYPSDDITEGMAVTDEATTDDDIPEQDYNQTDGDVLTGDEELTDNELLTEDETLTEDYTEDDTLTEDTDDEALEDTVTDEETGEVFDGDTELFE